MKRIIRTSLIIVGALVFAVGANAQGAQQYRAEIPFNFEAAGKHYTAGQYSVGPISSQSNGIAILERDSGKMRMLSVAALSGNNDWDQPGTLTFVKVNGVYRLREISTATFRLKMNARGVSRGDLARLEVVTIKLD